ncbi:MAG: DMT family transporter [Geobacteraceae bacterium]|nr:DMT family transporter [Geobacteraceae bacterium]
MRLHANPYFLLVLATLFWAGNFVLGRAVHELIPPVALVFWRWAGALLILLPFALKHVRTDWPLLRKHWLQLFIYAVLGVSCFNTFIYLAMHTTTATNALLLNSTIPVVIVLLSVLFGRTMIPARQWLGMAVSLAGVITIICKGNAGLLRSLSFNPGDLWVMLAVVSWALYTWLLRNRPAGMHPFSFLSAIIFLGLIPLAPLYAIELARGLKMIYGPATAASLAYVALFPSILSFVFWNQAVAETSPSRAGLFLHLMPVFGTLLSIAFLGETLHTYHLPGILMIFSGIWLTTVTPR